MVYLPMDVLMKHQVSQESVLRGVDSENIRNVTFEIATTANNHLRKVTKVTCCFYKILGMGKNNRL